MSFAAGLPLPWGATKEQLCSKTGFPELPLSVGFPEDQALEELAAVPVPEKENNRSPEVKLSNSLKIPFSKNKSHCGGIISALHLTTGETRIPY